MEPRKEKPRKQVRALGRVPWCGYGVRASGAVAWDRIPTVTEKKISSAKMASGRHHLTRRSPTLVQWIASFSA